MSHHQAAAPKHVCLGGARGTHPSRPAGVRHAALSKEIVIPCTYGTLERHWGFELREKQVLGEDDEGELRFREQVSKLQAGKCGLKELSVANVHQARIFTFTRQILC